MTEKINPLPYCIRSLEGGRHQLFNRSREFLERRLQEVLEEPLRNNELIRNICRQLNHSEETILNLISERTLINRDSKILPGLQGLCQVTLLAQPTLKTDHELRSTIVVPH